MNTERLIDLPKATMIWFIGKLESEQAYTLGLSFPICKMGVSNIYLHRVLGVGGGESKEFIHEKVELLALSVWSLGQQHQSYLNLLVMQNPGLQPRSPESETLGAKHGSLCFLSLPGDSDASFPHKFDDQ